MIYDDSKTRAKNRQILVDVAYTLFIENKISHTTVIDIVQEANMERKTFYNYFQDIEELANYIYYNAMSVFFQDGFSTEDYDTSENGYQKISKYFKTMIDKYIEFNEEMYFVIDYLNHFTPYFSEKVLKEITKDFMLIDPYLIFIEGVEDGSISLGEKDLINVYTLMSQSIEAYAFRLIGKGFENETYESDLDTLYDLLEVHLLAIKA